MTIHRKRRVAAAAVLGAFALAACHKPGGCGG